MADRQALELFGGAITVAASGVWVDISDFRPVPDHQEVWSERDGAARALVIEVLERVDANDMDALAEHFQEIARGNEASSAVVLSTEALPADACHEAMRAAGPSFLLRGEQTVGASVLRIELILLRLVAPSTDLLLSITRQVGADAEDDRALALSVIASLQVRDWGLFG